MSSLKSKITVARWNTELDTSPGDNTLQPGHILGWQCFALVLSFSVTRGYIQPFQIIKGWRRRGFCLKCCCKLHILFISVVACKAGFKWLNFQRQGLASSKFTNFNFCHQIQQQELENMFSSLCEVCSTSTIHSLCDFQPWKICQSLLHTWANDYTIS